MLKRIGLEERTPASDVFTGLGLFAVGVLVGAGLGLMFAPRRGDEMRQLVGDAWKNRGRAGQDFREHMGVESGLPPTSTGAGSSSH
jgi:gas vesicle protein